MKKLFLVLMFLPLVAVFSSCDEEDDSSDSNEVETLVGQPGNPRFNLQFTNPDNVDLDLYVRTPGGSVIYYGNPTAEGGTLDVDCLCSSCSQGPNENIYWQDGTAPTGTYEYWVNYFGDCGAGGSSSFTLRVIKNNSVVTTKTGTLSTDGNSTVWTHLQE
ncbi:MAG: hypothetical protein HKM28_04850 [Flavobacteriaceae bacterium]|nr:hypothetical protein [Flavobacteriaceae bacterium]